MIKLSASSKEKIKQNYQGEGDGIHDRNANMRRQFGTPIQTTKSPKLRNFRGGQLDGHAIILTDMLVFRKWLTTWDGVVWSRDVLMHACVCFTRLFMV